jgi:uroporphyrin-III C-methyltransferase
MAARYKIVVRLKGGDPNVFARASEEIAACQAANVSVVTVPGVTAAFAAAAALGAPLTARGLSRSLTFVTPAIARGGEADMHWAEAAAAAETAVIYMGALQAQRVVDALVARGVPASRPAALIESASLENQRIVRGVLGLLPDLVSQLGDGPALMIVGEAIAEAQTAITEAHAA